MRIPSVKRVGGADIEIHIKFKTCQREDLLILCIWGNRMKKLSVKFMTFSDFYLWFVGQRSHSLTPKYCYSLQMTKIYVQIIISCVRLDSVTLVNFLKELYE